MALIFRSPQFDANPSEPATHALLVGIGRYPYLLGGSEAGQGAGFPLRQLTSSPKSARAVADWLLARGACLGVPNAGLNNPAAPLGTVDLLLAEDPAATPAGENVDNPTATRLVEAIDEWVVRCNTHADNVAFLYFCGHGLKLGDLVFLASDFGKANVPNAWKYAISLDSIRLGMRKCKAKRQFMFFDCCRSYFANVNAGNERGVQIFDSLLDAQDLRNYVAMYSTLEGSAAYGKPEEPSYFTQALLGALTGFGSERRSQGWEVTNRMINKALHEIMRFDVQGTANLQIVAGESAGDAVLHRLRSLPQVKTRVQYTPDSQMAQFGFTLERAPERFDHAGANGPFRRDIAPGEWRIDLTQNGQPVQDQSDQPVLTPPSFDKLFPA